MKSMTETAEDEILTDTDYLAFARKINKEIKINDAYLGVIFSKVKRIGENFSIDNKLNITIPPLRELAKRRIEGEKIANVTIGGLLHENGHAAIFPFMTRYVQVLAIGNEFAKENNIPFRTDVFNNIENIISDVMNEIFLYHKSYYGRYLIDTRRLYVMPTLLNNLKLDEIRSKVTLQEVILALHTLQLASGTPSLFIQNPEYASELIYDLFISEHSSIDYDSRISQINGLGYSFLFKNNNMRIFEKANKLADLLIKNGNRDFKLDNESSMILKETLENNNYDVTYFVFLLASYKAVMTSNKEDSSLPLADELSFDSYEMKNRKVPSPDVLSFVYKGLSQSEIPPLVPPPIAKELSERLLKAVLQVSGSELPMETYSYKERVRVPWYMHPNGKIDPKSTVTRNPYDYKVIVTENRFGSKLGVVPETSLPDKIVLIIDESGSTEIDSNVLAPLIGNNTSVFDVERITSLAILKNVNDFGNVNTSLILFSDSQRIYDVDSKKAYDTLLNIDRIIGGGTEIFDAVKKGVEKLKDADRPYFILLTDMEISSSDAKNIRELLRGIENVPLLIMAVNANVPDILLELDKKPNASCVSIRSVEDYPTLEKAIGKLLRAYK